MNFKQVKLKHLWRELLVLMVSLIVGSTDLQAKIQFKDAPMTITHQPTMTEPYIVVEVLYFDAEGNDSYFTTAAQETGHNGPAVYVDGKWICSPFAELAWNTHQKTAASDISQDSWWKSTNPELATAYRGQECTYENEGVIIKFHNPHRNSERESGEYYAYMYVFLKEFKIGSTHTIKIKGTWKVNEKSPSVQEKSVTTEAFTNGWTAPTAVLTAYNKVTVHGDLNSDLKGDTKVGIYAKSSTVPSGYTTELGATKTISKNASSYSLGNGPEATLQYRFKYKDGGNVPVLYSYSYPFTFEGYTAKFNYTDAPIVYCWFDVPFAGFAYPTLKSKSVSAQWEKKVKIKWNVTSSGSRSTAGGWLIKNQTNGKTVKINDYNVREGDIEISDWSTTLVKKEDIIKVYFVPKGYEGDPIDSLSFSTKASILPNWTFSEVQADVITSGNDEGKIRVSWNNSAFGDASNSKPYTVNVLCSTDNKTFTPIEGGTVDFKNDETTNGSYVHSPKESGKTYYYKLKVENVMGSTVYSDVVWARSGGSKITSFTASRGSYSSMVKLQWTINKIGESVNFIVRRRPLGSEDENEWADIYSTSGTTTSYSYDDVTALPGSFNQYQLVIWSEEKDSTNTVIRTEDHFMNTDGFSVSTGIVSGNISYGTGTAVDGVKVMLKQQNADGGVISGMHSLQLTSAGSGVKCTTDGSIIKQLLGSDFSMQMFVNPDNSVMSENGGEYQLFYVKDVFDVKLKYDAVTSGYRLAGSVGGSAITSKYVIPAGEWSHISLMYASNSKQLTSYLIDGEISYLDTIATTDSSSIWREESVADSLVIGNTNEFNSAKWYVGYIDEFRLWTKSLTEQEIQRNYNHPLAGNESDLAIYYPFDEGIAKQNKAYDFSKKNGVSNGRHAKMKVVAASTDDVLPSENQLSLMSYTDVNGYYEIRGVPFSGEGTSYSVIPTLGIHEFSPAAKSRYISISTLNHSGVDFEDVSAFPVSGTVFYAGTDYPLEGATFYVDGTICSKDGEMIQSNEKGEFTISVPIGDHFITVKKNGHVFANEGRYPADPNGVGTKHTFNQEIKNMEFTDETVVNFTGRVVGGDIEGEKTVGFGLSNNNIGVTELILTPLNTVPRMNVYKNVTKTTYSYETNDTIVPIASATDLIASNSWRGAGSDDCRKLFIRTDSLTGEFSAMLPPLEYAITSMKVVKTGKEVGISQTIDLTNPLLEYADTLHNEDGTDVLYPYNTMLKQTYHSVPTFIVTQKDHEAENVPNDGAFGLKSYEIEDDNGKLPINDIYSIVNNKPEYKYGGAIFEMNEAYTFNMEGYEEYENCDGSQVVTDHVPLSGIVVTIDNALSDEQIVYAETNPNIPEEVAGQVIELQSNQLKLDDEGKAEYSWIAGLPNITAPYTRTISITYDIGDRTYQWDGSGMTGIVLGSLPTGNNFVTSGPDKVDMILRDPPGSGSSAEWSSGTVKSKTFAQLATLNSESHFQTTSRLGAETKTVSGFVGVGVISELEANNDLEIGLISKLEFEGGGTWGESTEIKKSVSTSSEPDFVGADGDVFIGKATNVIFGKCRNIDFHRVGATDEVELALDDVIATGISFGTVFHYTQHYIENELLPNLEMLRDNLLKTVTQSVMDSYDMTGKTAPVYLTTLSPGDIRYGSNNHDKGVWGNNASTIPSEGPSYKMIVPDPNECYQDSVLWCNTQIQAWKDYLAFNEQEKVEAFENRNKKPGDGGPDKYDNFSFDAGTSITKSYEHQDQHGNKNTVHGEIGVHLNFNWGVAINKTGVIFDMGTETSIGTQFENEEQNADVTGFSYTLAESGTDDALTVDIFEYGKYGPIFRTRGGQTSAPYEGEVKTKYYKPGTTIMEATMQIEVPQVDVDVPVMSDVPTGSAANYTLRLGNASEVNKDVTYLLFVLDGTNPDGAQISVDGQVLTEGRRINVPGGQTISKALQLKQTQAGVLVYDGNNVPGDDLYGKGIGIVFASESQPEDIADTVFIKARFTPSSSPVSLALSNSIMNTQTGTDLTLTFKDFDRNYNNLKAFRLEYKRQGATGWTQFKEYVLGTPTGNQVKLPETGASVSYTLPMASFSDGEYVFRVVSASTNGADEVYRYSEELDLIKDLQRPTPLGQPEPSDGILNVGDDLSVTFNEEIIKGEITKTANFKVTGVLNGQPVAHWTALSMQNTAAAASTEANINLAGKDFSFDAWVNLTAGAGTLLSHGNGTAKMSVGVNGNEQLVVNIAGKTYTSTNTVPTGKWAFLTLSYKNTTTGGILNATVADDANTTKLFVDETVVKYNGNGKLVVGNGITGSIHELLLWDEAHDMTTALVNRSKTKNPSTRHLIGYWKMDEGEGTSIRDYSRNRHMTMSAATWYLNNANKSVVLDGSHYLKIDASCLPVCVDDDYAVEFWMRGAAQADAQLLQMGEIALWVKADGTLQFIGKNAYNDAVAETFATNATGLTDNAWHHIAVNVLRQGAAAVYVDGVRCLTTSSANVGSINTNNLLLGVRRTTVSAETGVYSYDRAFTGQVDEVRVWNATMNSDLLLKNRKVRLTGTEDGLVAYYSFETQTLDEGNQVQSVGSAEDLTSNLSAELLAVSNNQNAAITYTDEAPAMRQKPTETNVSFTFVASNEKIVINIDEDPAIIEGCTLNFTVRDVRDENGNFSVPAVWSAFVNRNELVWEDDALSFEEEVKEGGEITAYILNNGGTQQMWTLSGMPSWLTASSEYGTTNPLSETEVIFYVSPATPIGKYEETIYLKGNDGIETPLTINVNVTGQAPDWYVSANDYESSMNVIGRVQLSGVPMDDADDILAAFIGEDCRGVAHPVYSKRYDTYYVTIDIYGNTADALQEVSFRAYDASTGTLYPVILTDTVIKYDALDLIGKYDAPVILEIQNYIEQSIDLNAGWNWISFNVTADTMTVEYVLDKIADDIEIIKSQTGYLTYDETIGWDGGMSNDLSNKEMYAVKMKANRNLRIVGHSVAANTTIDLANGWNWIGYYGRQVSSITDALADASPKDGDVLKGQTGVSYYDVYEWAGSLAMMEPGVGYVFKNTKSAKSFSYPGGSGASLSPRRAPSKSAGNGTQTSYMFNAVDYHNYSGNATMTAKVMKDNMPLANAELAVFADGECRAVAVTNEKGIAYLTIPGDDDATMTFKVATQGSGIIDINESIKYETDAIYGTSRNPYVFNLGGTTGMGRVVMEDADRSVYDLQGRKVTTDGNRNGILIIDGKKEILK